MQGWQSELDQTKARCPVNLVRPYIAPMMEAELMLQAIDTEHLTSDLDQILENAREAFSTLEREEAETHAREQADRRLHYEKKADKFRHPLELFLKVYQMTRSLEDEWRLRVFQGKEKFNPKVDRAIRSLYAMWLGYREMFRDEAAYLDRHTHGFGAELDGLERSKREAENLLRTWEPPVPSLAPSFRTRTLSDEATARLRELLPRTT